MNIPPQRHNDWKFEFVKNWTVQKEKPQRRNEAYSTQPEATKEIRNRQYPNRVCTKIVRWKDHPHPPLRCNLSPKWTYQQSIKFCYSTPNLRWNQLLQCMQICKLTSQSTHSLGGKHPTTSVASENSEILSPTTQHGLWFDFQRLVISRITHRAASAAQSCHKCPKADMKKKGKEKVCSLLVTGRQVLATIGGRKVTSHHHHRKWTVQLFSCNLVISLNLFGTSRAAPPQRARRFTQ